MCTIGAVHLSETESVLFKNKDFADARFNDNIVINEHYFGPQGLETFGQAGKEPIFSGLSLGINKHGLMVSVNHVKTTTPASLNYDLVVLDVIKASASVDEACDRVKSITGQRSYWWGNLVLADEKNVAAIEIRDARCQSEQDSRSVFRTNHQPLFGEVASPDGIKCSALRYESAARHISRVSHIDDVIAMLSTHGDQAEQTGICNHSESLKTVYSYILHRKQGRATLHVCRGNPCNRQWVKLPVPIGRDWSPAAEQQFLYQYPNGD